MFIASVYFEHISKDWRLFYQWFIIPWLLLAITTFVVSEPPRYLMNRGDYNEAKRVLDEMATYNGREKITEEEFEELKAYEIEEKLKRAEY